MDGAAAAHGTGITSRRINVIGEAKQVEEEKEPPTTEVSPSNLFTTYCTVSVYCVVIY